MPVMESFRRVLAAALLLCLSMTASIELQARTAARSGEIAVRTLSNRADMISGGDALVEVVLPADAPVDNLSVRLNGKDVTSAFARRADGRVIGLVETLTDGANAIEARVTGGRTARLAITNHPVGGPIFSGPHLEPWRCDTTLVQFDLGRATDKDCNAPTKYEFFYKHAITSQIIRYDPKAPPMDSFIARTTTDHGKTVPYIVRVETGTVNRGIYQLAVLFDPSKAWTAWAPQEAWNGKLEWRFGCSGGTGYRQGKFGGCFFYDRGTMEVFHDGLVGRGFMVALSTQTNLGNNMNSVMLAETLMMAKEHIVEAYGPIRYAIGQGGSGGSMTQHMIAQQYPGLLNGLRPGASFADVWSVALVNAVDCSLLNRYFEETSPAMWKDVAQKNAVYGYGQNATDDSATDFCHGAGGGTALTWLWSPLQGGASGYAGEPPCVSAEVLYDPKRNPGGVRCGIPDYMVNILGRRAPSEWGPEEKAINRGFGNRMIDRIGIQYGLGALEAGRISPEQFVDLNARIGGWDIDANWQPERMHADGSVVRDMYRTGQIVDGSQLTTVPIIDLRIDSRQDVHSNRQASFLRERMKKSTGTAGNRAEWLEPRRMTGGKAVIDDGSGGTGGIDEDLTMRVMDAWLSAIEADKSDMPLAQKVLRYRPADAADGCFIKGVRTDKSACAGYALDLDPLMVAGMPRARDIVKCQLKPLHRRDYKVTFTDAQWATLQQTFATGVCDWSKPGVGQDQRAIPWLTYANGPGGLSAGLVPASKQVNR